MVGLRLIDLLVDYCKICNDKKIIKPEGGEFRRREIISYPENALREVVLNAIEHANYFFRSNIKIEFFEDRLEISNPGNFYGGITLEQARHGVQSFRNPKLVHVMDKLGFVENFATGIETIFKSYERGRRQAFLCHLGNAYYRYFAEQDLCFRTPKFEWRDIVCPR